MQVNSQNMKFFVLLNNCREFGRDRLVLPRPAVELAGVAVIITAVLIEKRPGWRRESRDADVRKMSL